MDWIIEEFTKLSLGDKRLNNRAQKVMEHLSRNAIDSIPVACGSAAHAIKKAKKVKRESNQR